MVSNSSRANEWFQLADHSLRAASSVNSTHTLAGRKKKLSELQFSLEYVIKGLIIFIFEEGKKLIPTSLDSLLTNLSSKNFQQAVETKEIIELGLIREIQSKVEKILDIYRNPRAGGHTPLSELFDIKLINIIIRSIRSALDFLSAHQNELSDGTGIPVVYLNSFLKFHSMILNNCKKIEVLFLGTNRNKFAEILELTHSIEKQITYFEENRFNVMVWYLASIHLVNGLICLSGSLKESEERRLRQFDSSLGNAFNKICSSKSVPADLDWLVTIIKCYLTLITYAPFVTYLEGYWQAAKYPESGVIDPELLEHVDDAQRMIEKMFDNVKHLLV